MISIIISRRQSDDLRALRKNIEETIGVPCEIIEIVNEKEFGLCEAYNKGAAKASYSLLCFVHTDVVFHTQSWGKNIAIHLSDQKTGLIGVAGGCYKSRFGLDWKDGGAKFWRARIRDGVDQSLFYFNPLKEEKSRVVCVDGLFLCCRKEVWALFPLDEKTFRWFHFYDADWSMQVNTAFSNYVVFDVLIEHFSRGVISGEFVDASLLFEKKWRTALPAFHLPAEQISIHETEAGCMVQKLIVMKRLGYSIKQRWQLVRQSGIFYKDWHLLLRSFYFGFIKP